MSGYETSIEAVARKIARQEVASLCGLVMRRLQDCSLTALAYQDTANAGRAYALDDIAGIFGEALNDFGKTTDEPGE